MGAVSPLHLVLLLIVVLIIFGPGKLPDVARALGQGIREFRKATGELEGAIRGDVHPSQAPPAASSPSAEAPEAQEGPGS